ncbi:zinc finger protein 615-like [Pogonomyrmex barbatus]|uniref:Zinc finger protein 615-like n=1 Tax=Pogonomyrmex barbatus TaxID=144034 RepID=A0A6I9WQS8_9HYME|nr:zinc finger protein 615-like [Pogonomyrmex barbatus]
MENCTIRCRLCGIKSLSECSKYIFDKATNLAQIINETLPIKVSQDDLFKYICSDCYNRVTSHYDFIQNILTCSKETEAKIISLFEVNKNDKLENVAISKLDDDMIYSCPNCNRDLMILMKQTPEDCNAFQISLAVVDQIEKLAEKSVQICENTVEFINVYTKKSNMKDKLHELSLNNIKNESMIKKQDSNGIYRNLPILQKNSDTNPCIVSTNISCETNKSTKSKFQENVFVKTAVNPTRQKLETKLSEIKQNAHQFNSDYNKPHIVSIRKMQSEINVEEYFSERIKENDNTENMAKSKGLNMNIIDSQDQEEEINSNIEHWKQNTDETCNDYNKSSIDDLMFQSENDVSENETELKENDDTIDMTKIEEMDIDKSDNTNDNNIDILRGNLKHVCNLCGARYISKMKYEFHMERHKLNKIDRYVCLICDKESKNENLLWDHYLHMHKRPQQYICLDCNKVFTRKLDLNEHQKNHKHSGYKKTSVNDDMDHDQAQDAMKEKRKCTVCRKLIKDIDPNAINDLATCASCEDSSACLMIDGDVAKVALQRQYQCLKCRKHFLRRERLEFHEMRHNENMNEFICSTCGKEFSGENSLYEHYLFVHVGARPHICEVCGKSFQLKARLKEHLRKHTGEKPYQCEICGQRCMTSHSLKFHKKSHFPVRHACSVCNKSFLKKQNLNEHLEKHWKKDKNVKLPRIFTCSLCNCDLPTYRMLKHHMIGTHKLDRQDPLITEQKPLYECNECHEKFKHQMSLKAHKEKVHEGRIYPRIFQCDMCKAEYKVKQMLINHIRSKHNGEKRYKCAKCNMKFMDTKSLYHHVLLHTGRKPFSCEFCNMNFRRKSARDIHRRKHTNESYQCTDCNESFGSYSSRSNHRKKVHGNNKIECHECGEKYDTTQEFKIHLNKHLGEQLNKLKSL